MLTEPGVESERNLDRYCYSRDRVRDGQGILALRWSYGFTKRLGDFVLGVGALQGGVLEINKSPLLLAAGALYCNLMAADYSLAYHNKQTFYCETYISVIVLHVVSICTTYLSM